MKRKASGRHDKLYNLSIGILLAVFLGSGGMLLNRYVTEQRQEAVFSDMASMFPDIGMPGRETDAGQGRTENTGRISKEQGASEARGGVGRNDILPPKEWKLWWEQEADRRFLIYKTLKKQNPDMAGWIRIEGTRIDYPVMQTPDNPDYYLHRDFNKEKSDYGIPYMAEICRLEDPGSNLLIYGHHMRNGAMFAALHGYTEESYYREHPYIQFDSVDRAGSYEIAAAVKFDTARRDVPWQDLLFPRDEASWRAAWSVFEQKSFYPTGVVPEYEERLLALVTCEYTLGDGRLMVVAREIR